MKCSYTPTSKPFFECLSVLQRGSWPWSRRGSQSTNDTEEQNTNRTANNSTESKVCSIL